MTLSKKAKKNIERLIMLFLTMIIISFSGDLFWVLIFVIGYLLGMISWAKV